MISAQLAARVVYSEDGSPALVLNGRRIAAWNPPDLRSLEGRPLSQIWSNTGAPYALAAGLFNDLLAGNSALHVSAIDLKQTMNIAAWRTQERKVRILAGNLEEGLRDDADFNRATELAIPPSMRSDTAPWRDTWSGRGFTMGDGLLPLHLPQASSVLLEQSR